MKTKQRIRFLTVVMGLSFSFPLTSFAQQVSLETHQDLNQDALWFWYSDPNKPSHLFNRNISPKGDCIQSVNGYVFITWFKGGMNVRNLMLSRLNPETNKWKHIQFPDKQTLYDRDYKGKDMRGAGDSHRTTAVGVSPIDGTIHLAYDMHTGPLQYRISKKNIAFASDSEFTVANFSGKRDYFRSGERIPSFTYPNFEINDNGELIVEYRLGTSRQGDKYIVYYDGNQWSKTQLLIKGNNENPQFNQYGGLSNYFGKMYLGCSVRVYGSSIGTNQGFFYAEAGPRGNEAWKNLKGASFNLPIRGLHQMNEFKVASPLPNGHDGMTSAPKMVVSKNDAVHFTNRISGTGVVHYYSSPGGTSLKKAPGTGPDVSFPGDDGRVYSIGLAGDGKIRLQSTPEGQSSWRTDYLWNGSERFGLMEYDYRDGKIYIIASEKKNSDKLPLHYVVIDLGITTNPTPNKPPVVSFKTLSDNFTVNEGYKLDLEVNASDPDGSISNVKLYINNQLIRQENGAPYEWGHATSPNPNELNGRTAGTYNIKAVATDNKGKTAEKSITMTVQGNDPDNQAPVVSFVKPSGNLTVDVGYTLLVEAKASAANGTINNVKLYINNTLVRQEKIAPYEWGHATSPNPNEVNNLKAGKHTFKAVATDDQGKTSEDSFILTVNVTTDPDPGNTCNFGTPRNVGIPALDKVIYNKVYIIGNGGPTLDNFRKFTINWDQTNNGIYQFAINTNNGSPSWYVDFKNAMTFQLKNARPEVTLNNTGFAGLDGTYWVNHTGNSFILVSKGGAYSVHFSNAATKPSCTNKNNLYIPKGKLIAEQNPFSDVLILSGFGKNAINATLFDISGKQILHAPIQEGETQVRLNTEKVSNGIYFAKVITNGIANTIKIIKQ